MLNVLIVALAIALDFVWKGGRQWHPLDAFDRWADSLTDSPLLRDTFGNSPRIFGWAALSLILLPVALACWILSGLPGVGALLTLFCLFWALGASGLMERAGAIIQALGRGDLPAARLALGGLRASGGASGTAELSERDVARTALEEVLEQGNLVVFGVLFWYFVAGVPGVVLYRLCGRLELRWRARRPRLEQAARLNALLNWLPARLTALTYGLLGNPRVAWRCQRQAMSWSRPQAGLVMAVGAGSLGVRIGGPEQGREQNAERPWLGMGREPQAADIRGALFLLQQGMALWFLIYFVIEALRHVTI